MLETVRTAVCPSNRQRASARLIRCVVYNSLSACDCRSDSRRDAFVAVFVDVQILHQSARMQFRHCVYQFMFSLYVTWLICDATSINCCLFQQSYTDRMSINIIVRAVNVCVKEIVLPLILAGNLFTIPNLWCNKYQTIKYPDKLRNITVCEEL